jgi:prepilin-type N-terminal cleavage/methylation domain-containing protein
MKSRRGFTLVELLVAIIISSLLIGMTASIYSLFRRSMAADQAKADIAQNARVAMDRLSRELRQTPDIVTEFPTDPSDTSVSQPGEIEFENGHASTGDDDYLTYHRYYIDRGVLKLDVKEYYLADDPDHRVRWNSPGSPLSDVISTQDIATGVQSLVGYENQTLQLTLTTTDGGSQHLPLRTTIYKRN